ncbi:MAG: hypothetical protein WCG79_11305, partial [Verrucomicrobiota bacterium]
PPSAAGDAAGIGETPREARRDAAGKIAAAAKRVRLGCELRRFIALRMFDGCAANLHTAG